MIDIIFYFGTDIILVRVTGANIMFANSSQGNIWTDLSGLKLSKEGVIKEFPDLKNDGAWNAKAIERFKEKIKTMENETRVAQYIIEDLKKFGYIPKFWQEAGFRRKRL